MNNPQKDPKEPIQGPKTLGAHEPAMETSNDMISYHMIS